MHYNPHDWIYVGPDKTEMGRVERYKCTRCGSLAETDNDHPPHAEDGLCGSCIECGSRWGMGYVKINPSYLWPYRKDYYDRVDRLYALHLEFCGFGKRIVDEWRRQFGIPTSPLTSRMMQIGHVHIASPKPGVHLRIYTGMNPVFIGSVDSSGIFTPADS